MTFIPMAAYPLALRGREHGAELEIGEREICNTLRGTTVNAVMRVSAFSENQQGEIVETDYAHALSTGGGKPGQGYPAVSTETAVRRLTPLECERLMGWPDDWTAEGINGPIADSHRYRMCGNGVVAPVAEWIGRRL